MEVLYQYLGFWDFGNLERFIRAAFRRRFHFVAATNLK
jgi:hypothetical protein